MKRIAWVGVAVVLLAAGIGAWWSISVDPVGATPSSRQRTEGEAALVGAASSSRQDEKHPSEAGRRTASSSAGKVVAPTDEDGDAPQTEEEKAAAAEEAKVEAFDDLTDKWMDPAEGGVSMKDVEGFVAAFRQVPKGRRDECIHRALNLVPDENVMLLAGVLMDKTMDKETVESVFNDILNRDEDVKKPILQQVFKDKTHPCWADVAWIFDVTGEK